MKAVHEATIHRRVQEDGRERQERLALQERQLEERALQMAAGLEAVIGPTFQLIGPILKSDRSETRVNIEQYEMKIGTGIC